MPESDFKMQLSASMAELMNIMLSTHMDLNQLFLKDFITLIYPVFFPQAYMTEYPVVLRPSQPHYEIVYGCQSLCSKVTNCSAPDASWNH